MECRSACRLRCAPTSSLPKAPAETLRHYLADTREEAQACGLDLARLSEHMRCRARVGQGRCRKRVSEAAVTQYCCKHQRGRSLAEPGHREVEWALLGEAPREDDEYVGERDAQQRYHGKGILRRVCEYQGSFYRGRYPGMGRHKRVISYIGQCFLRVAHGKGRMSLTRTSPGLG